MNRRTFSLAVICLARVGLLAIAPLADAAVFVRGGDYGYRPAYNNYRGPAYGWNRPYGNSAQTPTNKSSTRHANPGTTSSPLSSSPGFRREITPEAR